MNERPQADRSTQDRPVLDPALDPLLARLRELDAAPADQAIDRRRQDDLLMAVLTAPAAPADPGDPADPADLGDLLPPHLIASGRRPVRRVGWIAAAAVTVAAASVAIPLTTGGRPAFASWTAEPTTASARDAAAVRTACLKQVGETVGGDGSPVVRTQDLQTRLSDRRGDWVSVLLTWTGADRYQYVVACLGELPPGTTDEPAHVESSLAGGGGWAEPTTNELVEGAMADFVVGDGLFGRGGEPVATTNGDVGPDVVGVTIHSYDRTIETVVQDGTYAAWWPGRITDPDSPDAPSGQEADEQLLRYDVTLRDGTVLRDVDPVHPLR